MQQNEPRPEISQLSKSRKTPGLNSKMRLLEIQSMAKVLWALFKFVKVLIKT